MPNRRGERKQAIAIQERLIADTERALGPDHPLTLRRRAELQDLYWSTKHTALGSVDEWERLAADCERVLGPNDPITLRARANLQDLYWSTKHTALGSVHEWGWLLYDCERVLGPNDPTTRTLRDNLASRQGKLVRAWDYEDPSWR